MNDDPNACRAHEVPRPENHVDRDERVRRPPSTALLLGATGLVGGHVLDLLLADPAYRRVTVLGRRPVARMDSKLDQRTADFDRLGDHAISFAVDDVFCCLGTTIAQAGSQEAFRRVDHDYVVSAARLAAEHGARRFLLVTAAGANARSRIFYNRVKGESGGRRARAPAAECDDPAPVAAARRADGRALRREAGAAADARGWDG